FASEIRFPSRAQRARRSSTNRSTVITAGTYHSVVRGASLLRSAAAAVALIYDGRRRSTRSRDTRSHRPALRPRRRGEPWLRRGPGFRDRDIAGLYGNLHPRVNGDGVRPGEPLPRRWAPRHPGARPHLVLLHPPRLALILAA